MLARKSNFDPASQLAYFTEGNTPEALVGVPPEWTPDQIGQFQAQDAAMGQFAKDAYLKWMNYTQNMAG